MNGDLLSLILGPGLAFLATLALIPPAIRLSLRARFVDRPGGRKDHSGAVPPIGGAVLFPVFMIALLAAGGEIAALWPLFAALVLILVTGVLDDYRHLNAWVKFSVHFICAGVIVLAAGAKIVTLDNIFGLGQLGMGFMVVPFSIISVVLFINAINLMDGLDGLAGGQGFIVLLWLAAACLNTGDPGMLLPVLTLMGALAGFLFYNMRSPLRARASVFLGDAGSMALGLMLGWLCINAAQPPVSALPPIAVAWILALPIMDICGQFYRRVREGRHPFSPDRGHFHHHLIHAGLGVERAVGFMLLIAFLCGAIGVGGIALGVPQWILTFVWICMLLGHIALSRNPQLYIDLFAYLAGGRPRKSG